MVVRGWSPDILVVTDLICHGAAVVNGGGLEDVGLLVMVGLFTADLPLCATLYGCRRGRGGLVLRGADYERPLRFQRGSRIQTGGIY